MPGVYPRKLQQCLAKQRHFSREDLSLLQNVLSTSGNQVVELENGLARGEASAKPADISSAKTRPGVQRAGSSVTEDSMLLERFATDIINKTLRILTASVRSLQSRDQVTNTTGKVSEHGTLSITANCGSTAFKYLLGGSFNDNFAFRAKVRQGLEVSVGKLIRLALKEAALDQLNLLRDSMELFGGPSAKPASVMDILSSPNGVMGTVGSREVASLVNLQQLAARYLASFGSTKALELACPLLNPADPSGLFSQILSWKNSGASATDVGKTISAFANILIALSQPNTHRRSVTSALKSQFRIWAAYLRHVGAAVDISTMPDSSVEVVKSVDRYLKSCSSPETRKQAELQLEQFFPKLLHAGEFTINNYNSSSTAAKIDQRAPNGHSCSEPPIEDQMRFETPLQQVLISGKDDPTMVEQCSSLLESLRGSAHGDDYMSFADLERLRGPLMKRIISCPEKSRNRMQTALCNLGLAYYQFWHSRRNRVEKPRRSDEETLEANFLQLALMAGNRLTRCADSPVTPDVLETLLACDRDMRAGSCHVSDPHTLLALSNLEWRLYLFARKCLLDASTLHAELLAASVDASRRCCAYSGYLLDVHGFEKRTALVKCLLQSARDQPGGDEDTIHEALTGQINQLVLYLSESGRLRTLAATSTSSLSATLRCDEYADVRTMLALLAQTVETVRRPLLKTATATLPCHEKKIALQAWLLRLQEPARGCFRHDLQYAITYLLAAGESVGTSGQLRMHQQLLFLAVRATSIIEDHMSRDIAVAGQELQARLQDSHAGGYEQHIHHCWTVTHSAYLGSDLLPPVQAAILWWSSIIDRKGLQAADVVDDIDELLSLLAWLLPYLENRGWTKTLGTALALCDALLCLSVEPDPLVKDTISSFHVQNLLERGQIDEAWRMNSKISPQHGTTYCPLEVKLSKFVCEVRLACVRDDHSGMVDVGRNFTSLCLAKGLKRSEQILVMRCQADVAYLLADWSSKTGQPDRGILLLNWSLLLLRSVAAASSPKPSSKIANLETDMSRLTLESTRNPSATPQSEKVSSNTVQSFAITSRMIKCLILQAHIHLQIGLSEEAGSFIRQAFVIANTGVSPPGAIHTQMQALRHEALQQSHSEAVDPDAVTKLLTDSCRDVVFLFVAYGDWEMAFGNIEGAIARYDEAEKLLLDTKAKEQTQPFSAIVEPPAEAPSKQPATKARATTRPRSRGAATTIRTANTRGAENEVKKAIPVEKACDIQRDALDALITRQHGLASLRNKDLETATILLNSLPPNLPDAAESLTLVAQARLQLALAASFLNSNVSFGSLAESALSVPSCHINNISGNGSALPSQRNTKKKDQDRIYPGSALPEAIHGYLLTTLDNMRNALPQANIHASTSTLQQISWLSSTAAMFLSAVEPERQDTRAAFDLACMIETPSIQATLHQQRLLAQDPVKAADCIDYNPFETPSRYHDENEFRTFQEWYVEILPEPWTVVSLHMNEEGTELRLVRYRRSQPPFVLRLPMSRQNDMDLDENEPFTFAHAKTELVDIIQQSDHTCHNPPAPSVKGGKSAWWNQREALDARLCQLLESMEDIWLGGFKGIFSLHDPDRSLLARFRKSIDVIFKTHLPSRQNSKSRASAPILHDHVISLFLGLDPNLEDDLLHKLDDDVLDILLFVVELLQWHGEPNAHDEVDFDSMVVDTIDAMRAYHQAAQTPHEDQNRHLILCLDKRLHGFPWESMPCLQGVNITRVASVLQIRERILAATFCPSSCHAVSCTTGMILLNPSGDLVKTEETLTPMSAPLISTGNWSLVARQKPAEDALASHLSSYHVFLYFGHGSGSQYIRERTVQRLKKCSEVVWLMGCSSGKVRTHGELESRSVPLSYLLAGSNGPTQPREGTSVAEHATTSSPTERDGDGVAATEARRRRRQGMCMSVIGTLWDVTDRDIDRFSVSVGKKWGLFASPGNGPSTAGRDEARAQAPEPPMPKTPAKRSRATAKKTPSRTPARTPAAAATTGPVRAAAAKGRTVTRDTKRKTVEVVEEDPDDGKARVSLAAAVAGSRDVCYLRYLNGAASVVYGIPTMVQEER